MAGEIPKAPEIAGQLKAAGSEHGVCSFHKCKHFIFSEGLCVRHHHEKIQAEKCEKEHKMKLTCSKPSKAFEDFGPHMDPDAIWNIYKTQTVHKLLNPWDHTRSQQKHSTRFVVVSDTHGKHDKMIVPPGDVLIHCGDFSAIGLPGQIKSFNDWLGSLPHKQKVVIAGNHDLTLDEKYYHTKWMKFRHKRQFDSKAIKASLTNCIYLEDALVDIRGFRIWGSPWQPTFCDWGFNLDRGPPLRQKWDLIPDKVDILVTHGPPLGFGDMCKPGNRVGCMDLLDTIQMRVRPKLHLFGHIHEDYGLFSDDTTLYANASSCTYSYRPTNPPIVIDLPNPYTRDFSSLSISSLIALNQPGAKGPSLDPRKPPELKLSPLFPGSAKSDSPSVQASNALNSLLDGEPTKESQRRSVLSKTLFDNDDSADSH
eukprot:gb/GEZN01008417.1/.p1 GENE.gb/GEZN01008417.1/~~gb/GEZN01008417.1/.p1  ORF type:complete len:424 (-),score=32.98 gb/GEZN01008417.1/:94-1365(-)